MRWLAALALLASCSSQGEVHRYEAEHSPWKTELTWKHEWWPARHQYAFESLKLLLDASRRDEDLAIDGQTVTGTYDHGGTSNCTFTHTVVGTVRLLEVGSSHVRARVEAVMKCPQGEAVPLKGEFAFDVKASR